MSNVEYLSNGKRRSREPILSITKNYYGIDKEPVIYENYEMQEWIHGTGTRPELHPGRNVLRVLDRDLPNATCGYCDGKNVLVISLQGCVHPMSGDAYYDYEIVCQDCKGFTCYSYAEN